MTAKNDDGSALRKQLEDALAEKAKLAKELVVAKTGIDLEQPMAKFFFDHYDGEWEPDAFSKAASEVGLLNTDDDNGNSNDTSEQDKSADTSESQNSGDGEPKSGMEQWARQMDSIYQTTEESPVDTTGEEAPAWSKASNLNEFLASYDGQTV